jgi:enamine deaminase RidA (YjgF/YER057c/UK114 family)
MLRAPAVDLPQRLHAAILGAMERQNVSGHAPLEPVVGYSRAVRVGGQIWVSGTAPIPPDGSDPPPEPYDQARLCLEIVAGALERAGARLEDVVRTRIYVVETADFDEVARAHGEVFGEIRPATSGIVVKALLDPRWLVEIEADAILPSSR